MSLASVSFTVRLAVLHEHEATNHGMSLTGVGVTG